MYRFCSFLFSAVAFAVLMAGPVESPAADQARSNLDVCSSLTSAVAKELLSEFPGNVAQRGLFIVLRGSDEQYEFIKDIFTSTFVEEGMKVFSTVVSGTAGTAGTSATATTGAADTSTTDPPGSAFRLEVQALEFGVKYPKIFRSHLFGGRRVKRRAEVKISATLIDPVDNSVVWVKKVGRDYEDQFPFNMLAQVEDDLFTFTKPVREKTRWSRVVEPVVVSGIIVGLIYLFFSNQSGD